MHFLKTNPIHFEEALNGKDFEIRLNDRDYKVGDRFTLKEFCGVRHYYKCPYINHNQCFEDDPYQGEIKNCIFKREYCTAYDEDKYSGREIIGRIENIFNLSDITKDSRFENYIAFKFKIINKRKC
ncbi:MAG: DUF3850 domain-containing protein [Clostridia bacterium]|nr:DUF3850 domain-containing protein [Clostridia bacterium]